MLQLISLIMLIYSFFLIKTTLPILPPMIPTHFNAAGVADGWGSPDTLWFLLAAQAMACGVWLVIPYVGQRNPGAVHFGRRRLSEFTPAQRARMVAILNDMSGYMSVVMSLFFVVMLHQNLAAARQPNPRIHPFLPVALLLAGVFGIMLYYMGKFRRAVNDADEESRERTR